jgi:hypothetical protein
MMANTDISYQNYNFKDQDDFLRNISRKVKSTLHFSTAISIVRDSNVFISLVMAVGGKGEVDDPKPSQEAIYI